LAHPERYLELPGEALTDVRRLAQEAAGSVHQPLAEAKNIESYLRSHYAYSLELPGSESSDPIQNFLFNRRKGPCSYFASAMAVMLRLRGIPCRIAAGYAHGEWNEPARQYLIRQKDAHAWVEVYDPALGWVPFDPTPAEPQISAGARPWTVSLRQYWDYLTLEWERLVIQYDLYAQLRALEGLRHSSDQTGRELARWWGKYFQPWRKIPASPDAADASGGFFSTRARSALPAGIFGLAALSGFFLFKRRRAPSDSDRDLITDYRRFLRRMAQSGCPKAPSETAWEYAARLDDERPEQAAQAWDITQRYYRCRFAWKGTLS